MSGIAVINDIGMWLLSHMGTGLRISLLVLI